MGNPNYQYKNGTNKIKINGLWIEPTFAHYENVKPIGEPGANGVVLKGKHKITGREDAIKIWLPRERNGKMEIKKEQYLAEVQKIAKLNDPRIATIYDAWTENGFYCSSMELIDGITYKKWLENNSDICKRVNILIQIFETIVFFQSKGILHGDLHSKNIMIDKNEKIHIIDFGTSCMSSYKEQSKYRENTLLYELVKETLAVLFDNKVFLYKKYATNNPQKNNDIRNAVPLLFSKSVLSYLHLVIMLIDFYDVINQPTYLYKYCTYIAKGSYLSLNYFYSRLPGKNTKEKKRTIPKYYMQMLRR